MKQTTLIVSALVAVSIARADIQTLWIPVFTPETGDRVHTLVSDGDRIYAGAGSGIVFSDDNGNTWRQTGFQHGVGAMAVDGDTIYAGEGWEHGIFRSDDRGETWKPTNNGLRLFYRDAADTAPTVYGSLRQILITRSGTVIAVMYGAIQTSDIRGEPWQDVTLEWFVPGGDAITAIDLHFTTGDVKLIEFDGHYWITLHWTIVRSPDKGRTWTGALASGAAPFWWPTAWVAHNNRLYIAAEHYAGETAYFGRYEDGLMSQPMVRGLPPHGGLPTTRDAYIEELVSHNGRIFAAIRRRGVYVFNERTETWSFVGLNGAKVYSLVSHQSHLYAATDEGIYRASIPIVSPYDKTAATWGSLKTK